MSGLEGYTPVNGSAGNSAPAGGRRHHHAKKVSAKTIRAHLRKHGLKPKGRVVLKGGDGDTDAPSVDKPPPPPPAGGRRRHHGGTKKHRRRRHASASFGRMFGL